MIKAGRAGMAFVSFFICISILTWLPGCGASLQALLASNANKDQLAQQVFELTNEERANEGIEPLVWNDKLAQAGADHCQDMIDRNYFAHNSPDGLTPGARATIAGYSWLWVGENIAKGYPTAEEVMEGWMNSPDHKDNILRPQFKEIGIAVRFDAMGIAYWAQEFGTPIEKNE